MSIIHEVVATALHNRGAIFSDIDLDTIVSAIKAHPRLLYRDDFLSRANRAIRNFENRV